MSNDVNPASFLGIPSEIRDRIYRYTGLVTGYTLYLDRTDDIIWAGLRGRWFQRRIHEFNFGLLHTCYKTRLEVTRFLFAQNCVCVPDLALFDALQTINDLPPEVVAGITDLVVEVHKTDGQGFHAVNFLDDAILALWQRTITHVLSIAQPRTLSLSLTCDLGDCATTWAVLKPLLQKPGILRDLELRLWREKEYPITALANDAANIILGRDHDSKKHPFRYFDLPPEIRHHILQYTDVVTPYRHVEWKYQRGFYSSSPTHHPRDTCSGSERVCEQHHRGNRYSGCPKDFDEEERVHHICRGRYSAYSSQCQCWEMPQYMFLVSKAMSRDAAFVFYSSNHFVVTSSLTGRDILSWRSLNTRLHASRFITRNMQPELLHHLRKLELVIPPLKACFQPEPSDLILCDWRFAVEHLNAHANLPNLTLIIHMSLEISTISHLQRYRSSFAYEGDIVRGGLISPEDDTSLRLKVHMSLLKPFLKLRDVGRLFIHLEWPWHWSPDIINLWAHGMDNHFVKDELADRVDEMELWLEQFIMGADYNSHALGKKDQVASHWLYDFWAYDEIVGRPQLP